MARTRAVPRQAPNRVNRGNRIPNFGRAPGVGVKRLQPNKRDRKWKIKKFNNQPLRIDVKHRNNVVRRMIVRRSAVYPKLAGGTY